MRRLGPLDRRVIRKRCVACARRKIKCQGTPPCVHCVKRKQKCIPQETPIRSGSIFINTSSPDKDCVSTAPAMVMVNIDRSTTTPQDQFVKHFFLSFLARNDLGGSLDLGTIISCFQSSPSLHSAVLALGASDMSRSSDSSLWNSSKHSKSTALMAYRTSVIQFQSEIEKKSALQTSSSLWTTFFLGLFELMYDVTGDGWVKHILYGTSKILQLRGPDAHLIGSGRSFFLTIRVFEICRALIYAEPTFLADRDWVDLMKHIWDDKDGSQEWHPKEGLFDLMIACSSLSHSVWDVVDPDSQYSPEHTFKVLNECIIQGHHIQSLLTNWYTDFQAWTDIFDTHEISTYSALSTIYYHAISIYLSGIFDYRTQFLGLDAPSLPRYSIQTNVDAIILHTAVALSSTNLAGVLLFFPLRVAGARVTTVQETVAISGMLSQISQRGYVVANAFIQDLAGLWQRNGVGRCISYNNV